MKPLINTKNPKIAQMLANNEMLSSKEMRIFKQIVVDDLVESCKKGDKQQGNG